MGISGACRREELCKISINDVQFKTDLILINLPDTKTNVSRQFAITKHCWIELLLRYFSLRPDTTITRFFLTYHNGKCIKSPVGINTIGKIPSQIAQYLKLDNATEYTGHCFRRSSATLLANNGGDVLALKRHGGWKSARVAEGYVEDSVNSKITLAETLTMIPGTSKKTVHDNRQQQLYDINLQTREIPGVAISAPANCVFNINIYNSAENKN